MAQARHKFPCQQCGAQLIYQPGTSILACEHCGHEHRIAIDHRGVDELDFYSALDQIAGNQVTEVSMAVKCENCAAEFEFDKHVHADECPYCGTRIVSDVHENHHIKPWGLLPFKVTAGEAAGAYRDWLNRLWFAPGRLKKYARKDQRLNGMYIPYWTYDCVTRTDYVGERGTLYQEPARVRVRVNGKWTTQTRMVTKIRWKRVSGRVGRHFDDVLIFASTSLPRNMARELAPWDLQHTVPYKEEYLSGFRSEMYQTGLEEGFNIARQRMHPVIKSDISADIGGDQQRILNAETEYSQITFKHILLPFWVAGFRFGKKSYQFIVNARTGEVQGDRPYSKWKIFFAGVGVVLMLLILLVIFGASQQSGYYIDSRMLEDLILMWGR